ncbi:MAG: hypothetical protein A3G32_07895 [Deltaproteobacteria bacterium RIFCSPLOWO2_12_FULL_40_28]|nr:MAG: hypothetical protein A3C45_00595 [Deltaproteobacteria bacterium RIFCSPHIGHO2_02_FULL_40_28]OGQ20834.1 MAG: hypothetical protein A3E27_03260 [Deltaproteobacteria bacterium RIFCSPHIGHO2_12_FULL_40_32]OGQ39235.1 MAG: hypothetical protein A3I69_04620 [Deltaproteobacteria bacterium RIFCSPLOWO2_02_FULL_40_36]OGQ54516.1 MAG: hypothetical protein A3G32_07895 [Deltaproteobacteria bacterium RIFCSPLOWO2_12_FULL_40_28]
MKNIFLLLFYFFICFCFYLIFFYAPIEATQGVVQKIFYFHVASAFAMYLGFGLSALFAIGYLLKRNISWDIHSHTGAGVGLVFASMVLLSGPLWAKPIWGTWWTWDPRLTTTLLIWLIFASSLLVRDFFYDQGKGKVLAALITLFGLIDMPLIFLSVKLWRGIHPSVLGQKNSMPIEMRITLIVSIFGIFFLFALLYYFTYRIYSLEQHLRGKR